jgi:hypothetical protein
VLNLPPFCQFFGLASPRTNPTSPLKKSERDGKRACRVEEQGENALMCEEFFGVEQSKSPKRTVSRKAGLARLDGFDPPENFFYRASG